MTVFANDLVAQFGRDGALSILGDLIDHLNIPVSVSDEGTRINSGADHDKLHESQEAPNNSSVISVKVTEDKTVDVYLPSDVSGNSMTIDSASIDLKILQSIIEKIPAGVVVFDRDNAFVACNEMHHELYPKLTPLCTPKHNLEDIIRFGAEHQWNLEDEEKERFIGERLEQHQQKFYVTETKLDDSRWIRSYNSRDENGLFIGMRFDITERVEGEEKLRSALAESEFFNTLVENLPLPVYAREEDLTLKYANRAWGQMFATSVDEAIGKTDTELFGTDGEAWCVDNKRIFDTMGNEEIAEQSIQQDGSVQHRISYKRAKTTSMGDTYLFGAAMDVTENVKYQEELEVAQRIAQLAERAKSEFLANMSHEIRTPMNGVMGMAELLTTTELDPKQKMFTDVIVKSGASLLTIINDILDFSKIDAGQMELDPAPFVLAEAIEDVATLVSSKVAEKDLELIVRVDPKLPEVILGDVGRIRQIVTNLMGNAVKFTEKGHVYVNVEGEVTRSDDCDLTKLRFSVEDTGIGIPQEKCDTVFQKFSQVDTSATRKHEGTGLGLSISSSLVELMGGKIGVESDVGQGSTFWFEVELPAHGELDKERIIPGDLSGARILIIDDNQVNRSILTEQMASWGFDSAAASSGREGLDVMRAASDNDVTLDLVILDYQMPEMDGAEILEIIRSDNRLRETPIVMLTSVDSSETNKKLKQLGVEANLTKPTRSSMLLETILQVMANNRANIVTRKAMAQNRTIVSATQGAQDSVDKSQTTNRSEEHLPPRPYPEKLDILVAEDNEINQIVFRQILEETGLNFRIAENGRLAFAAYKAQQPRLILMDVSMPEMNGKEATTAIRKYEREKEMRRTPIVGVSAHALKGDMEACIDVGMDDYLSKPISPNKLNLKISQWLKLELDDKTSA